VKRSRTSPPATLSRPVPPPRPDFGASLADALRQRRSQRDFAPRALPDQVLGEILWCAYGINRPATADRTAPSWRHARETEIFAAMADGVWRYDALNHRLLPHLAADIRAETGMQDFVGTAPLSLVFVTDADHLGPLPDTERHRIASADTGFIGQNVYLYCAATGLACVFRGSLDTAALARRLALPPTRFVTFAQTVGYPA
jgi:nitroreductase